MSTTFVTHPYTLTQGDFVRFCTRTIYGSLLRFPGVLIYICAIFVFSFMFGRQALDRHDYAWFAVVVLACVLFWLVVIPGISVAASLPAIRQTAGTRNSRVLTASEDGIHFKGTSIDARLNWSAFQKVSVSRNLVSLFVTPNCAHLVHRDAFDSPQQADAFVSLARAQIAAARVTPTPVFETVMPQTDKAGLTSMPYVMTFVLFLKVYTRVFYGSLLNPVLLAIYMAAGAGAVWLAFGRGAPHGVQPLVRMLTILAPLAVFYVAWPMVIAPFAWMKARKMPMTTGERCVALTLEGVHATGKAYDSRIRWQDLYKVARGLGVIYFQTRKTAAIAVPVTAFAGKAEAEAFYQAALGYWRAAKEAAAKSPLDAKA